MKWKIEFLVNDAQGLEQTLAALSNISGNLLGVGVIGPDDRPDRPPRTAALQNNRASLGMSQQNLEAALARHTTKPQSRNSGVGKGYRANSVAQGVQRIVDQFDKGYRFNFKELQAILGGMGHPAGAKLAARQKIYKLVSLGIVKKLPEPGSFMKS